MPENIPLQPLVVPTPLPQPVRPTEDDMLSVEEGDREFAAEVEEQPGEQPSGHVDELADLFEVPDEDDNDMYTDDLVDLDEEEDLSDLTKVTEEDVMGRPPRPANPRYQRTSRPYEPPTSMGGTR